MEVREGVIRNLGGGGKKIRGWGKKFLGAKEKMENVQKKFIKKFREIE